MHEWILDVWEYFETGQDSLEGRITPTALPGWWYTRALAMKIREDTARSQASEIVPSRQLIEILGISGPRVEHPGVCRRSVTFSFTSSVARR